MHPVVCLGLQAPEAGHTANAAEEMPPATSAPTAAALAPAAGSAQQSASDAAPPPIKQRDVPAEFAKAVALVQQRAGSQELMAAATPLLLNVAKCLQQLAARTALDAAAGTLHPASQLEPLTQLNQHEGWSLKRHEPACFGSKGARKRQKPAQQQPSAAQVQQAAAQVEPFVKPARKASTKKGPLIRRLPGYQPKGQENAAVSNAAQASTAAAPPPPPPAAAVQPLAPAAGGPLQHQQPAAQVGCLLAPAICVAQAPAAAALQPQGSLPGAAAAVGPAMQIAPTPGLHAAAPAALPVLSAMSLLQENVPPMGWPAAAAGLPCAPTAGLQPPALPPAALMQLMAALVASQQPNQPPNDGHS